LSRKYSILIGEYKPTIIDLSILNITVIVFLGVLIIDSTQLRKVLSANIKDRRKKLGISQEKLAEMAHLSVQMVNSIEGYRAWVSDKTLIALSQALGIEVFQLFTPSIEIRKQDRSQLLSHWLVQLQQDIKKDITADVDSHFERLLSVNLQE
jgi:transcriptional regulator with XRE-family HTH domain